ncbi:MAG: hypothetical protein AB7T06_08965 [Kofleriaceae bacterium]
MNRLVLASILALGGLGACTDDGSDLDSTLTIENESSYAFAEIYLSPEDAASWGNDLLGADILAPGEVLELSGITCDVYDIRIVDDEGDDCVLASVDLCLDDAVWSIDDAELAACQF